MSCDSQLGRAPMKCSVTHCAAASPPFPCMASIQIANTKQHPFLGLLRSPSRMDELAPIQPEKALPAAARPAGASIPDGLTRVMVDGLPFVATTVAALAGHICRHAADGQGGWVVTPNVDILRRWHCDPSFRELVSEATMFTADGLPIVWASRLQGDPLPARLPGSDLFVSLFKLATQAGLRVALIGGNEGSADKAVNFLSTVVEGKGETARTYCPPLGFERKPAETNFMRFALHEWQPHIVFIGLPCPKQEKLIRLLRPVCPKTWFLGVGVSFSFVAGDVQRAPLWVQHVGLEWLHRLQQEPRRLAKRYLRDDLPFALGLLARSWLKRFGF
jgi:N-acetylglucosaminyldiphosphoundecaprenol N-acetyl-beta-D-mannosaminyltransferase